MLNPANKPKGPANGIELDLINLVENKDMYITVPITMLEM